MYKQPQNAGRAAALVLVALSMCALILFAGFLYFYSNSHVVRTDNATVRLDRTEISAMTSGQIGSIKVVKGQFVKRRDVLFTLDPIPLEARADFALMDLIRIRSEIASTISSTMPSTHTEASGNSVRANAPAVETDPRYQTAKARYRQAVFDVQNATVRSAVSGTVSSIHQQVGDKVNAGQAVLELVDEDRFWVEAHVPARKARRLNTGQRAQIELAALPNLTLSARLTEIRSNGKGEGVVNAGSSVFVRLVPEYLPRDSVLQSGQAVSVSINTEEQPGAFDYLKTLLSVTDDSEKFVTESAELVSAEDVARSTMSPSGRQSEDDLALQRVLVANAIENETTENTMESITPTQSAPAQSKTDDVVPDVDQLEPLVAQPKNTSVDAGDVKAVNSHRELQADDQLVASADDEQDAQLDAQVTASVEGEQDVQLDAKVMASVEDEQDVQLDAKVMASADDEPDVQLDAKVMASADDEPDVLLDDQDIASVENEPDAQLDVQFTASAADEPNEQLDDQDIASVEDEHDSQVDHQFAASADDEPNEQLESQDIASVEDEQDEQLESQDIASVEDEHDAQVDDQVVASAENELVTEVDQQGLVSTGDKRVTPIEVTGVIEDLGFPDSSIDSENDNQWVLNLPPDLYTLQIVSGSQPRLLKKVSSALADDRPHMLYQYKNKTGENAVYALATGLYRSREEALQSLESIDQRFKSNKPWIRRIKDIQNLLTQQ